MEARQPRIIFNMLSGYKPITNVLGAGDPNVHKIDDRWWMFFGGFQRTFKNNLFSASLPNGEPLHGATRWTITASPGRPSEATPLVAQPGKGAWDHTGLHEPCFVEGLSVASDGNTIPCRRVYYSGRSSRKVVGNETPFSIGFLELTAAGWQRHPDPVITGDADNPSVVGPKIIFADGKWRLWHRATPREPAKGEHPVTEIRYTESSNGVDGWSPPRVFFSRDEGFAHAFVLRTATGYEMLLSKSPNLFGESFYPPQNLWFSRASTPRGDVRDWSPPTTVLAAANGEAWYRNGFFGSCLCEPEATEPNRSETRTVFFTGVHTPVNWPAAALRRLTRLRRPPVPAPFYFAIGRTTIDLPKG